MHSNGSSVSIISERYQVKVITQEDGLLNNNVFSIAQDNDGFLWFGTGDGLNRYDGYDYLSYRNKLHDTTTLSDNFIRTLLFDSKDLLWIGTISGGVSLLDKHANTFKCFSDNVADNSLSNNTCLSLLEDREGNVWVGTENGLNKIAVSSLQVSSYFVDTSSIVNYSLNGILSLYIDSSERLWMCTRGGVYYVDDFYTHAKNSTLLRREKLAEGEFRSVYEDKNGTVWLAGERGVFKYQHADNKLEGVLTDEESFAIIKDTDSTIWVGYGANLCRVNVDNHTILVHDDVRRINSAGNQIRYMFKDHSGVLWLSLRGVGLIKISTLKAFEYFGHNVDGVNSFGAKAVRAITADVEGDIWVATSGSGLNVIDKLTGSVRQVGADDGYFFDHALALHGDKEGNVWAGIRSKECLGLVKYNIKTKQSTRYNHEVLEKLGVGNKLVRDIYEDSQGMYWLGLDNGVDVFDPQKEEFVAYYVYDESRSGLAGASVQSGAIVEDNEGNIWVGTWEGLTKINLGEKRDYQNPKFEHFYHQIDSNSLVDDRIMCLCFSADDLLWIGTYGGGISCYDPKSKRFSNFSTNDGLANNVVYGIQEDDRGNIWLSTNFGLSMFDVETKKFNSFYKYDGLQHNQFYWGASYADDNHMLYFGGVNGLTVFNASEICYDSIMPKIVFTELTILNKSVNVGESINGNVVLNADINHVDEVVLTHKEKIFSIGFSVLHYVHPESNYFSYKLEGFSDEWVDVGSERRFVTYTNLPSGEYVLRVRGANYNGIWALGEKQLKIVVKPPFWETWLFIVSVLVFVGLLVWMAYGIRVRNLKRQKNELKKLVSFRTQELEAKNLELETHHERLERLVDERTKDLMLAKNKAEESDRLKTAFLANMSHEIRTPLNAIVGFSSLLTSCNEEEDEKKAEFLSAINNSTDDLLHLVDDIIDLSRIESNNLPVNLRGCSLKQLLFDISPIAESLLHRYHKSDLISFSLSVPDVNVSITTDEARVRQVFVNLIANAIKFTNKGTVECGCTIKKSSDERCGEVVEFYVKDSGVGISPEICTSVFDRFVKSHETDDNLYRGAGLGLPISKKLVDMLGGKMWLESEVGVGSVFYFTLPYVASEEQEPVKAEEQEAVSFESIDWSGRKILVAEDEDSNYEYLKALLRNTDVCLVRALNGEEVVAAFLENKFDLILMDIRMPIMDGYEATRKIKQVSPKMPIVALTAYGMCDDEEKCRKAGCDAYISKPFAPEDLVLLKKYMYAASG